MTTPTGNVFMDPDTGKPANPRNIQSNTGAQGLAMDKKYGPGVLGPPSEGTPEAMVTHQPESAPVQNPPAELPEISGRAFGPGVGVTPTDPVYLRRQQEDLERTKILVRDYGRILKQKDAGASAHRDAKAKLALLADKEYARDDGGRPVVKKILATYGVGRPKGGIPDEADA